MCHSFKKVYTHCELPVGQKHFYWQELSCRRVPPLGVWNGNGRNWGWCMPNNPNNVGWVGPGPPPHPRYVETGPLATTKAGLDCRHCQGINTFV
jgi:hypothetical protein